MPKSQPVKLTITSDATTVGTWLDWLHDSIAWDNESADVAGKKLYIKLSKTFVEHLSKERD